MLDLILSPSQYQNPYCSRPADFKYVCFDIMLTVFVTQNLGNNNNSAI